MGVRKTRFCSKKGISIGAEVTSDGEIVNQDPRAGAIVGHVGIEVKDLDRSRRFYSTLLEGLGFSVVMDDQEAMGFSNANFQVWLSEMRESRVSRKAPTGEELIVADHLAILVKERKIVEEIQGKMKKVGFEPLFPCEEHPQFEPGYYAVSFCDPDNYVVEIHSRQKLDSA